jgi:membrane-associated protein
MDLIRQFVDMLLHLDQHLGEIIAQYQAWTYAIVFAVIFLETLPPLTPLLPGGALLLAAGSFAAKGSLSMPLLVASLAVASVVGDTVNYWTGRWLGPHVFRKHGARFFDHRNIERAHAFYARYGPVTLLLARFLPFIRTLFEYFLVQLDMPRVWS